PRGAPLDMITSPRSSKESGKSLIPVAGLVLLAAALVTGLLLNRSGSEDPRGDPRTGASQESWALNRMDRTGQRSDSPSSQPAGTLPSATDSESPTEASLATGSLILLVEDEAESRIPDAGIRIIPAAGRVEHQHEEGILITDLPAGSYFIEVWADGYVNASTGELQISPSTRSSRRVVLQRGLRLAGRVVDEKTNRGVARALIRFGTEVQTMSDDEGRFFVPRSVSSEALRTVSTSHPDYDDVTHVRPGVVDSSSMTIALTRGDNQIEGVIDDPKQRMEEASIEVVLTLESGPVPVVRRRIQSTGPRFRIKDVNTGTYGLTVRFPGTGIPDVHQKISLAYRDRLVLTIPIPAGASVQGLLTLDKGRPLQASIDLLNEAGQSILNTMSTGTGEFRFSDVPPGKYRFRVHRGNPYFNTQPFEILDLSDRNIEITALNTRWVDR
ncbi:MAG TPA: carboxypeptidase-like regulatory domain-containing protein, partial [Planctomycetota bacterium]|nr:carboxypeptidase-like regulatory domain-containing protein [Planctomycetota bacterium]